MDTFKTDQSQKTPLEQTKTVSEWTRKNGIGLTGGVATGKSTVAKYLTMRGFLVIDADLLSRIAYKKPDVCHQLRKFQEKFRPNDSNQAEVTTQGPTDFDRKLIGSIIFKNPEAKKALEEIAHPAIQREFVNIVFKWFGSQKNLRPFFYEAALLFENGRESDFAAIWATFCPLNIQMDRLMLRDQLTEKEALARIRSQMPAKEKCQRSQICLRTDQPHTSILKDLDDAIASLKNTMVSRF